MDDEQRKFFDAWDNLTEQSWISEQYAGLILSRLVTWHREGRPVGSDAIEDWATEREHDQIEVGMLVGIAIVAKLFDTPEVQKIK